MESQKVQISHYQFRRYLIILTVILFLVPPAAYSRDTTHFLSIEQALQSTQFQTRLDPSVRLYFGGQKHPKVTHSLGTYSSNRKTNAFNKTVDEACQWVLLSTLLSLQDRAKKEGGNAVVNISSYYRKNIFKSNSKYECHTGAIIAGVAMRGRVVKLAQ